MRKDVEGLNYVPGGAPSAAFNELTRNDKNGLKTLAVDARNINGLNYIPGGAPSTAKIELDVARASKELDDSVKDNEIALPMDAKYRLDYIPGGAPSSVHIKSESMRVDGNLTTHNTEPSFESKEMSREHSTKDVDRHAFQSARFSKRFATINSSLSDVTKSTRPGTTNDAEME